MVRPPHAPLGVGRLGHREALIRHLVDVLIYAADGLTRLNVYSDIWTNNGGREVEELFLRKEDKVAAEAMLLAYLATRVFTDNDRVIEAINRLIRNVERQILTPRNEALLRRFPQSASSLGQGHVLLTTLGKALGHREMLTRAAKQRFISLSERTVFRHMDTRWTYGLMDETLVSTPGDLIPYSVLASNPHPIYTMKNDEYAITHCLFYLTDFGLRPPPEQVEELIFEGLVDHYLAWSAVREDLDLLGEFLAAAVALRTDKSPSFEFAWDVFFRAWDEPGGLVGPDFSFERHAQLEGDEADAYSFSENYHTIFVGGILSAIALSELAPPPGLGTRDSRDSKEDLARCSAALARFENGPYGPPSDVEGMLGDGSLEWTIARLLAITGRKPDPAPIWLQTAKESRLPRELLNELLYDPLLTSACREYSLTYLAEALAVGATLDLTGSDTYWRALAFLTDQQVTGGFIGIHKLLGEAHPSSEIVEAQAWLAGCLRHVVGRLN